MANPEHLKILKQGVKVWNQWRKKKQHERPDLSETDLSRQNLVGANLASADLVGAILIDVNLNEANLNEANLFAADLSGANLLCANLEAANLGLADLVSTNLSGANLHHAILIGTKLAGTTLTDAQFNNTTIGDVDLSTAIGLETVNHWGPSSIGIDTLYKSQGKIPDEFLRESGVPGEVLTRLLPLIRCGPAIQWHSCFISYSSKDEEFTKQLIARMRAANMPVFFAAEDMKGGEHFSNQIEHAIQRNKRLLLVLSKDSMKSKWVEREIKLARKVEKKEKRLKLLPIRLTTIKTLKQWKCLDHDTGEDLAEEVRKYHIPDFSNWKDHDSFEAAFADLQKALRAADAPRK